MASWNSFTNIELWGNDGMLTLNRCSIAALVLTTLLPMAANGTGLFPEPMTFTKEDSCVNPMIQVQEKYTIGEGGLSDLVGFFEKHDLNNDNQVCMDEIRTVSPNNIQFWMRFDMDGDGCITPQEASRVLESMIIANWEQEFRSIDGNRNGIIEWHELVNRFGQTKSGSLTPQQIMEEYDLNNDHQITLLEYVERSAQIFRAMSSENPKFNGIESRRIPQTTGPKFLNKDPMEK